jgi:hypothetical protein
MPAVPVANTLPSITVTPLPARDDAGVGTSESGA